MAQSEVADLIQAVVERGVIASDVSISPAVRPDVAKAVMKALFDAEVIDFVRQHCDAVVAADKAERSKVKPKNNSKPTHES